ncbi:SDR family NAD(P)-dependent oxidoreductase [Amycolatopsis circi]|uniref:SDR family NAD(P)-dependent oxidoreductase n=1 Tax=Amycolatopsis circi TaxID=871959 RepID=UPI000E28051A|nr:SDR family oxidoreductase [Amycolatopsis circi]
MAQREHAVVTGGSSGIGLAVVRRLLDRGLAVTVFDRQPPPRLDGFPGLLQDFRVDVSDEDEVRDAFAAAAREAGPVRRLVASHGIRGQFRPALDLDLDACRRVLDVHVVGTLVVAREMVRALGDPPASIVALASTTAYRGWANQADYGVAKAAVRQLVENLAIEWAGRGVRVNAVAPGHTLTPMVQQMIDQGYDTGDTCARTPLGRLADPGEQAGAIEFLLLDAPFVTGVCLPVDGGWTAVGK